MTVSRLFLMFLLLIVCSARKFLEQFAFQPGKIAIWMILVKWAGSYFQWSIYLLLNT